MKNKIVVIIMLLFFVCIEVKADMRSCAFIGQPDNLSSTVLYFKFKVIGGSIKYELFGYAVSDYNSSSSDYSTRKQYSEALYKYFDDNYIDGRNCSNNKTIYCGTQSNQIVCGKDNVYSDGISFQLYNANNSGITDSNQFKETVKNHLKLTNVKKTFEVPNDFLKYSDPFVSYGTELYKMCCGDGTLLLFNSRGASCDNYKDVYSGTMGKRRDYTCIDESKPSEDDKEEEEKKDGEKLTFCQKSTNFSNFFDANITVPLRIVAVILFIVLTTIEYSKVLYDKEASHNKANIRTFKRFVALLVIFFANSIIGLISTIIGMTC